jgi:hypothetical protein
VLLKSLAIAAACGVAGLLCAAGWLWPEAEKEIA